MSYLVGGKSKINSSRSDCYVKAQKTSGSNSVWTESRDGYVLPRDSSRSRYTEDQVSWQWPQNLMQAILLCVISLVRLLLYSVVIVRKNLFPVLDGVLMQFKL